MFVDTDALLQGLQIDDGAQVTPDAAGVAMRDLGAHLWFKHDINNGNVGT
jgi:hypothetical protein